MPPFAHPLLRATRKKKNAQKIYIIISVQGVIAFRARAAALAEFEHDYANAFAVKRVIASRAR